MTTTDTNVTFEDLFDSKEQAVMAYLRMERKYLAFDPKRLSEEKMTTTNQTDLEALLEWAEGQRDSQTEKDSNFIIVNNCYKSIWGQVVSKIQSMIIATK
jgi:hypothetical protein